MRKFFKAFLLAGLLSGHTAHSQIELAKLIHEDYRDMLPGIGAALQFAIPVTEAGSATVEAGALLFFDQEYPEAYGVAMVPVKVGYRHILNGTAAGFYVQPQVGYNVFGYESNVTDVEEIDRKFNGFIWSAGIGYLFPSRRGLQFNLGLRYETILDSGSPKNFIALRLSHNFSIGRRSE